MKRNLIMLLSVFTVGIKVFSFGTVYAADNFATENQNSDPTQLKRLNIKIAYPKSLPDESTQYVNLILKSNPQDPFIPTDQDTSKGGFKGDLASYISKFNRYIQNSGKIHKFFDDNPDIFQDFQNKNLVCILGVIYQPTEYKMDVTFMPGAIPHSLTLTNLTSQRLKYENGGLTEVLNICYRWKVEDENTNNFEQKFQSDAMVTDYQNKVLASTIRHFDVTKLEKQEKYYLNITHKDPNNPKFNFDEWNLSSNSVLYVATMQLMANKV